MTVDELKKQAEFSYREPNSFKDITNNNDGDKLGGAEEDLSDVTYIGPYGDFGKQQQKKLNDAGLGWYNLWGLL